LVVTDALLEDEEFVDSAADPQTPKAFWHPDKQ
jgi:hypothetical protein